MNTNIVYFDETGDDGLVKTSSDAFILTSIYEEMHIKYFLSDKDPYRKYNWTKDDKLEILKIFTLGIAMLDLTCVNVIIDKNKVKSEDYKVLENALKYNIQMIVMGDGII